MKIKEGDILRTKGAAWAYALGEICKVLFISDVTIKIQFCNKKLKYSHNIYKYDFLIYEEEFDTINNCPKYLKQS